MDLLTAMWTTAVVGAIAVYWFVWVMGSAEVKGKRAVNLKMRLIMQDKVQDKYISTCPSFSAPRRALSPRPTKITSLPSSTPSTTSSQTSTSGDGGSPSTSRTHFPAAPTRKPHASTRSSPLI
ncbi:hypothetical protein ZIOFF_069808 [Zingiber officinale]|uniref:Uncharacterized protein n=1 Tax=Zingiber officinale TaxID=94328 RepID=A0A8J5C4C3_ZINOF|nr:hypothetical protein ZIOFF_069808 [Zingiber officinale]